MSVKQCLVMRQYLCSLTDTLSFDGWLTTAPHIGPNSWTAHGSNGETRSGARHEPACGPARCSRCCAHRLGGGGWIVRWVGVLVGAADRVRAVGAMRAGRASSLAAPVGGHGRHGAVATASTARTVPCRRSSIWSVARGSDLRPAAQRWLRADRQGDGTRLQQAGEQDPRIGKP